MKKKKTLSNWLTSKYLLIIRNEENFAEKSSFSFNYGKLILFIILVSLFFLFVSFYLSTTILSSWFDPRARESEFNEKLVSLSFAVDSLSQEVQKKEEFIFSLKKVMTADLNVLSDEKEDKSGQVKTVANVDLDKIDPVDLEFREEFEKTGVDKTTTGKVKKASLESSHFFPPIKGVVSSRYNSKIQHYGIDVVAPKNEPVKAVADGTVIISSWTQDSGYVVAIQHKNNLISFYKHNSALLKKVGNFVKAGDLISIIGNSGELTNGPHLHFELWYEGNPVNPQQYFSF